MGLADDLRDMIENGNTEDLDDAVIEAEILEEENAKLREALEEIRDTDAVGAGFARGVAHRALAQANATNQEKEADHGRTAADA